MDQDAQTIVEQEVEEAASAVTEYILAVYQWLRENLLTFESVYELAVIAGTLVIAVLFRARVARFFRELSEQRELGVALQRLIRTVSSIALPVTWSILLSISIAAFEGYGLPIGFLRLVISLLVAFIVIRVVSIFIPSAYWSKVFSWVAWTAAALNAVGVLDILIEFLRNTGLSLGPVNLTAWALVQGVMLVALLIWGGTLLIGLVERRLSTMPRMSSAMSLLIVRLMRLLMVVLAVVIALAAIGVDLTVFAVFSGALGIGIGLGLQRTVGNLIASYTLLADQSVKPGDVIEVETTTGPTYGQVTKMTTRYVSVRTRDGTETLIPNEVLIANPMTNWSHSDKVTRRRLPVGIAYDADVDLAIKLCIEAAGEVDRILKDPPPKCLMREFGDSSINIELRFWINDPENGVANVTSDVMLIVWRKFQAHSIEIPFPQRDLNVKGSVIIDASRQEHDPSADHPAPNEDPNASPTG
ncbi:MAG: mechanosensitive ion channel domain-containing protein [Pseudomonadota bacterium]